VNPDGTWVIRRGLHWRIHSDHRTRGTNQELGKEAVIHFMAERLYI
jgi:hypothetical protein